MQADDCGGAHLAPASRLQAIAAERADFAPLRDSCDCSNFSEKLTSKRVNRVGSAQDDTRSTRELLDAGSENGDAAGSFADRHRIHARRGIGRRCVAYWPFSTFARAQIWQRSGA